MPNRTQLAETAADLLVQLHRKERAGDDGNTFYRQHVEPAIRAAVAAGANERAIHANADKRYGQWLIANAGS
jgi:hypothetical protein